MVDAKVPILQAVKITYRYPGGVPVFQELSFDLRAGEKTVLLGPNGAGKSTLLFSLLGMHRLEAGEVFLQAKRLADWKEAEIRQRLAYLFQNPDDQVFAPTVEEDVLFGPQQFGYSMEEQQKRLTEVADWLQIHHLLKRNPRHISYGEKRRVALAGVLILNPQVIFFDEPLAFLDPPGQQLFLETLERLATEGKTLLVATHDLNFAAEWGERILFLQHGKMLADGDRTILREGFPAFGQCIPLPTQIFQGFAPDDELPVTVAESRQYLRAIKR
jgi:cobalt/nickel transport system ATP-binding protein